MVDLRPEPVVVETSPQALGMFDDRWRQKIVDFGLPGPDRGADGRFLLVSPGYDGALPASALPRRALAHDESVPARPRSGRGPGGGRRGAGAGTQVTAGYGRWARDVLVWTTTSLLFRNELVAVDGLAGEGGWPSQARSDGSGATRDHADLDPTDGGGRVEVVTASDDAGGHWDRWQPLRTTGSIGIRVQAVQRGSLVAGVHTLCVMPARR